MALRLPLFRDAVSGVFVLLGLAALIGACFLVGREIADAKPARGAFIPPTAVVWGNRVFSDRPALTRWLHYRGVAYTHWAQLHAAASRVLADR
jgi:hypothetical protein